MFIPPSCIDLLFDYTPLLTHNALCKIPHHLLGKEIAIVGAGAAGMIAAHELLKMGLKPIIYEASHRIGGRLYSKRFDQIQQHAQPLAELGAMRIPQSSRIFFHYANKMGINNFTPFSSPGMVETGIYYKNRLLHWHAQQEPPSPFNKIKLLWDMFNSQLIDQLHHHWHQNNLDLVKQLWQMHIDQYKDKSFYEVIKERSPITRTTQMNAFGSLGMGGGGFSPLFNVSFLEVLRFSANRYLENLCFFPNGVSEFIEKLFDLPIEISENNSLATSNCLKLNTSVISLDYNTKTKNPIIIYKDKNNAIDHKEYYAVIFTGSVAAAQLINMIGKTKSGVYLLNEHVRDAIKNTSTFASSKTFICTQNKFWRDENIPKCILTDELFRAMYFIDYPQTNHGVVCLSYTWGADALKLHAVDPKDRVIIFRRVIANISEKMNSHLEPLNNEVISIDWVNEKYQNGAFNLFFPGNDERQKNLYFQFQSSLSEDDTGLYLAGDSVSWSAGWVEGALYTGLNAVYAVAKRLGAEIPQNSPLSQKQNLYHY